MNGLCKRQLRHTRQHTRVPSCIRVFPKLPNKFIQKTKGLPRKHVSMLTQLGMPNPPNSNRNRPALYIRLPHTSKRAIHTMTDHWQKFLKPQLPIRCTERHERTNMKFVSQTGRFKIHLQKHTRKRVGTTRLLAKAQRADSLDNIPKRGRRPP